MCNRVSLYLMYEMYLVIVHAIGLCSWMCTWAGSLDVHLDLVVCDVQSGLVVFNVLLGLVAVEVRI